MSAMPHGPEVLSPLLCPQSCFFGTRLQSTKIRPANVRPPNSCKFLKKKAEILEMKVSPGFLIRTYVRQKKGRNSRKWTWKPHYGDYENIVNFIN